MQPKKLTYTAGPTPAQKSRSGHENMPGSVFNRAPFGAPPPGIQAPAAAAGPLVLRTPMGAQQRPSYDNPLTMDSLGRKMHEMASENSPLYNPNSVYFNQNGENMVPGRRIEELGVGP